MKKTIGYDASFAVNQYRGMGVFVNSLKNVLTKYPNIIIKGLSCYSTEDSSILSFGSGFYPFWEQVSLPKYLKNHKPDIFIFPYNTMPWKVPKGIIKILILHDLIFLHDQTTGKYTIRQWVGKYYRSILVKRAYKQADFVITVSEHSKAEIIRYLGTSKEVQVIPNILKQELSYKNTGLELPNDLYILNVGGEAPSKNVITLVEAYCLLPASITSIYSLKLVGRYSSSFKNKVEKILNNKEVAKNKIEFCGYVTNEQLAALYANCSLFVFPSIYEGFGIPLIEAMQFNKPVIVSNTSCMPEIMGKGGIYFDPTMAKDLKEKIEFTLSDNYRFESYQRHYREQMEKYSEQVFEDRVKELIIKKFHL
ncbi:MAG: glycosyltransferase family 1 protein [Bacteroidota bacterium]